MKCVKIAGKTLLASWLMVSACAVDNANEAASPMKDELVSRTEPEAVSGKVDVYTSMARAAKYNVDTASANLNKKIFSPTQNPRNVVQNIMNMKFDNSTPLYEVSNALEYATLYATANLNNKKGFVDSLLYTRAAQHLTIAAIRTHQDAWFASRKLKEIDRLSRQEQKKLNEVKARLERTGTLSKDDREYKKGLEVALMHLGELQQKLAANMAEYGALTNMLTSKVDFAGRHFYELEDFDKNYSVEIFQESAVNNRTEFSIAKELVKTYSFDEVKQSTNQMYEDVERLDINGVDIDHRLYSTQLQERALQNANDLIDAIAAYANEGDAQKKAREQKHAFDLLGTAILAQVKVNYKLVQLADIDYRLTNNKINTARKKIKEMERKTRLDNEKKIELLNLRIDLLQDEFTQSQINAERAVALRTLYFEAGFSPYNKRLLKAPLKDIEQVLKAGFNDDAVKMLAAAGQKLKQPQPTAAGINSWARSNNWLEELIDGKGASKKTKAPAVTAPATEEDMFAPYGPEADKYKIMQLGSFEKKQNANEKWQALNKRFAGLKAYMPQIERSHVGGKIWYRLLVSSVNGGFREICNELRAAQTECLLR